MSIEDKMVRTTIRIQRSQLEWVHKNRPQQLSRICRDAVQEKMHEATPVSFHNAWRESAQKCFPHKRGGYCGICWPAGVPDASEWRSYISNEGYDHPHGLTWDEWVMVKHGKRQNQLDNWNRNSQAHEITEQESRQTMSDQGNIGFLRSLWRKIF